MNRYRKIKESDFRAANEVRYNKHRNRKNNDLVAAMYAMYLMGPDGRPCTLEEIGRVYRRSRQAVYDSFKSRGYVLRSKPVKPFVMIDGRKFTPRHDAYWRATAGDRKQLHVYIWEKVHGRLPDGHGIHHKDLDRGNNAIENLECLPIAEISSKHNPHLNQFTSPTGSRKWKRGRIIPLKNENETTNIRPSQDRSPARRVAVLRDLQHDPSDRFVESWDWGDRGDDDSDLDALTHPSDRNRAARGGAYDGVSGVRRKDQVKNGRRNPGFLPTRKKAGRPE